MGCIVVVSLSYLIYKKAIFADSSNTVQVLPGWGFITGNKVFQLGIDKLSSENIFIYSYNDPSSNKDSWTFIADNCSKYQMPQGLICKDRITLNPALAYLYYNPSAKKILTISNPGSLASVDTTYLAGWHILAAENTLGLDDFAKTVKFRMGQEAEQTLDKLVDRKLVSSEIYSYQNDGAGIKFKRLGYQDSDLSCSKTAKQHAWVYLYGSAQKISFTQATHGNFKFGFNLSPSTFSMANQGGINIYNDMKELHSSYIRYINADKYLATREADLSKAINLKNQGNELLSALLPQGPIQTDRQSTILDSDGAVYTSYTKVIDDVSLYSQRIKAASTTAEFQDNRTKLINLLQEHYFKGIVIPRLLLYKDYVKGWQPWNEPDGLLASGQWAIPPETLALLTGGQAKYKVPIGGDKNHEELISLPAVIRYNNQGYDLSRGTFGIIKSICPDCEVVSSGFFRRNQSYFTNLKYNNYENYVDANEIHLNLSPQVAMGYTRYYDLIQANLEIYHWLCDKDGNAATYDCGKPLYSTETGSPGGTKQIGGPNAAIEGFTMTFTNNFQADDLIKRMVSNMAAGITKINWNGYLDNPGTDSGQGANCPVEYDNQGLLNFGPTLALCHHPLKGLYSVNRGSGGFTAKSSYMSYKLAVSKLFYAKSAQILKAGDSAHNDLNPVFLFKIEDNDGKQKFAAWCEPFWNVHPPTATETHPEFFRDWNYEERTCFSNLDLTGYGLTGKVVVTKRDGSSQSAGANSVSLTQSPIFIEAK